MIERQSLKDVPEYLPKVKADVEIDGLTLQSARNGEKVDILTSAFLTSYSKDFATFADNLLKIFLPGGFQHKTNYILIHINSEKTAFIYVNFPMAFKMRLMNSKKAGDVIFKEDILAMESVEFRDSRSELKFEKGDQIIFLFRKNWHFGLYFNLNRDNSYEDLGKSICTGYRYLEFAEIYEFLSQNENFENLISMGWFPFISLVHNRFESLLMSFKEPSKLEIHLEILKKYFTSEILKKMTDRWWQKKVFSDKRSIIEAGITSYLEDSEKGYITAIKTLITELEGIIRISYVQELKKKPSFEDLANYLVQKGHDKYGTDSSLGFPGLFYRYLSTVIFKNFDLNSASIDASRHGVAHGVAGGENYTWERALQTILCLDQIYFFLP